MRCAVFLAAFLLVEAAAGQEPLLSIPRIPDALKLAGKKDQIWIWTDNGKELSPGCSKALIEHEGHLIISPGYVLTPAGSAPKSCEGSWNWCTSEDPSPKALEHIGKHRGPVTLFLSAFTSECADALMSRTCDMTINIKWWDSQAISRLAARQNCPFLHLNLSHYDIGDDRFLKKDRLQLNRLDRLSCGGWDLPWLTIRDNPNITITHHRELRRWASKNERVHYDAQYQSIDANRNVRLRLVDGTFREVPLDELRGADRGFVLCAERGDKRLEEITAKERDDAAKPADPFQPVVEDRKVGK